MTSAAIQDKIQSYGYVTTDTNTTYSAGTNISLVGTTFNVNDVFLKNNAVILLQGLNGRWIYNYGNMDI